MINRSSSGAGASVTFVLDGPAASVVGDFNDWDPAVHPLVGGRATVALPPGRYRFRYLIEGGAFQDDPDADLIEDNGWGETHSVLVIEPATDLTASNGAAEDLKVITGIGPKIAGALSAAGIAGLADLAELSADRLKEILKTAGLRTAPTSNEWPTEAARLLNGR